MSVIPLLGRFTGAVLLVAGSTSFLQADNLDGGRKIFTETAVPNCALCHTLADAGAEGAIGPNLDTLVRTADEIRGTVMSGVGVMPAFADILSEAEIATVAEYVAAVAGK